MHGHLSCARHRSGRGKVDQQSNPDPETAAANARVWDVPVRLMHWSLVALVAISLATGLFDSPSTFALHIVGGTGIAVLVLVRVVWGFTGTQHARFSDFVKGPAAIRRHLREVLSGRHAGPRGHNPVAALMIVTLLALLMALAITGVVVEGGVYKEGPAAAFASYSAGRLVRDLHESLAFLLAGLVAVHVAAAIFESVRTRESLVRAMITGRKRHQPHEAAVASEAIMARPVLASVITAALAVSVAAGFVHLAALPAAGVPSGRLPASIAKECGACHTAYHPSIAPRQTWNSIMSGLSDHFGENASLDEPLTGGIRAYLLANASEVYDTKAANLLRTPSDADRQRITVTRGWQRLHRDVPEAAFKSKSVGGRLNCSKCHSDAEAGHFSPRNIAIPSGGIE